MRQALGRKTQVLESGTPPSADAPRVVLRRRVAAVVHLADGSKLAGDLYAAAGDDLPGGEPILERLNDPDERYLPLARGDRHFLVNKTAVRCVELAHVEAPREVHPAKRPRVFGVEVTLDSGESIRGHVESRIRETHYRTLDQLNDGARGFLRIVRGPGVAYVNHDHVVAVCELSGGR